MTKEVLSAIQDAVGTQVFGIWFLIGAALVFFMQAGFAMVETGFTRAKNAGNIIMKNLMDFCIGTCVFIPLGFQLCFRLLLYSAHHSLLHCVRQESRPLLQSEATRISR